MPKRGPSPREEGDVGVVTEKKVRTQKPRLFRVILHNDDFTTADFVVEVLVGVFHKDVSEATALMQQVHNRGMCVAGVYTCEVAETKVAKVEQLAQARGYPFLATMEPE